MKYRKRTTPLDAIQWKGDNFTEISQFVACSNEVHPYNAVEIPTRSGNMTAYPGDYIVKYANGQISVCDAETFNTIYEPVSLVEQ